MMSEPTSGAPAALTMAPAAAAPTGSGLAAGSAAGGAASVNSAGSAGSSATSGFARVMGWRSGAITDSTAPDTQVTAPSASQDFTLPTNIATSGSANDNVGVASVKVAVLDRSTNKWWQGGSSWGGAAWFDAVLARPGARSTGWTWTWKSAVPGDFTITTQAVDTAGNRDRTSAEVTIRVNPRADTTAPSTPTGLIVTPRAASSRIDVAWSPSADDTAVTGYEVKRNGAVAAETQTASWTDTGVVPDVDRSYTVRARDAAGNWSAPSAPVVGRISSQPATGWSFGESGLDGAGFQNVVDIDPAGSGVVLSGADVAGIHRSTNLGVDWQTSNEGINSLSKMKVADIAWSRTQPGLVYAATGAKGAGGGLMRSTDGGRTWSIRSTVPQFSGGNNSGMPALPGTHPRSTGNLLVLDEARGYIYAATFDDGVMRSSDGGTTWTTLGLEGKYLRSLVVDPSNPDVLYVAAYNDGVYKTSGAAGAGTFVRLVAAPSKTEELAFVGGDLYTAAGTSGVFRSSDGGAGWTLLNGPRTDGPVWMSVAGYVDGEGRSVVFVGCDKPAKATKVGTKQMFASVMRSIDGGSTWASIVDDPTRVHFEMGGPAGSPWWLASSLPSLMLGQGSYTAAQIVLDQSGTNVFVAGRSGVWRSPDGGQNWWPAVHGMGVTINREVVADPNVAGRVYVGNTDWILLWSTDGGNTIAQNRPPSGAETFGISLDTTVTPSAVTIAVGDRDTNSSGEIYTSADPVAGAAWANEGLGAATGGKRPLAVAVNHVGGERLVLAAVEDGGVWRKSGATWTKVNAAAMGPQATDAASFAWQAGSSTVFLYDRQSGVWRSTDAGRSWAKIWSKVSATEMTGYVVLDPLTAGRLWVAAKDGLYRIDDAASADVDSGSPAPLEVGALVNPSEPSFDTSGALVTIAGGHVYRSVGAGPLQDVSDDVVTSTANFVFGTSIGPDDRLYLALNGNGLLLGAPRPLG